MGHRSCKQHTLFGYSEFGLISALAFSIGTCGICRCYPAFRTCVFGIMSPNSVFSNDTLHHTASCLFTVSFVCCTQTNLTTVRKAGVKKGILMEHFNDGFGDGVDYLQASLWESLFLKKQLLNTLLKVLKKVQMDS